MRLAIVAAGFTAEDADRLRKAMATFKFTDGVAQYREKLVGGMVARGYDADLAERVFKQIEGFGSYGFPESHAASFAHLAYASAWLKQHHPSVFACALLNSQPMGFYAPAQIVRDAEQHGVRVRSVDVNVSQWDSILGPDRRSAGGLGMRLGLRLASGLPEADGRAIAKARRAGNGSPFASIEEVVRRAGVGKRAVEALAAADAFVGMGLERRRAMWDARAVEGRQPSLFEASFDPQRGDPPLVQEPVPLLPEESEGEAVVADYMSVGMTLRSHPLALLRSTFEALGFDDTRKVADAPNGSRVKLPGLVLMRQRPGTAAGVTFVTVEDEHGTANLVVWKDVAEKHRPALVGARLMVVTGRIERVTEHVEIPVNHVICKVLEDRSDLLASLSVAGSGAVEDALPASRDFR